jgi:hypothetical protein
MKVTLVVAGLVLFAGRLGGRLQEDLAALFREIGFSFRR